MLSKVCKLFNSPFNNKSFISSSTSFVLFFSTFNIKRPEIDKTTELLEYQPIFELNFDIKVRSKLDAVKEKALKDLLILNEQSKEDIEYPIELDETIKKVRNSLVEKQKQVRVIIETLIEKKSFY